MNYVNNRIIPGHELPVGNTGTAGEMPAEVVSSRAAVQSQAAGEDLMRQLMDDLNATNNRPASQTVLDALKQAGLPASAQNRNLVSLLLNNGMSISKDSLREFVAEQKAYPSASFEALVAMRASDIPINSESVTAVTDFLSNEQIISNDINTLAAAVGETLSDPSTSPELAGALKGAVADAVALLGAAVNAVPAEGAPLVLEQNTYRIVVEATPASLPEQPETEAGGETLTGEFSAKGEGQNAAGSLGTPTGDSPQGNQTGTNIENAFADRDVFDNAGTAIGAEQASDSAFGTGQTSDSATNATLTPGSDQALTSVRPGSDTASASVRSGSDTASASVRADIESIREKILTASPKEISKLIKNLLSANSKDITKDSVRKLYETSEFLFGKIREAAQDHTGGAHVAELASKASDDIKLLNQLNNMYPQIEVPLKFDDPRTSGSLYVYANKKRAKASDNSASALLHLNMPSLGPVDIKLALKGNRLSMSFYTDEMAKAYLKADLGSLEKNLADLDLLVSTIFKNRDSLTEGRSAGKDRLLKNPSVGAHERLSFDIRA